MRPATREQRQAAEVYCRAFSCVAGEMPAERAQLKWGARRAMRDTLISPLIDSFDSDHSAGVCSFGSERIA